MCDKASSHLARAIESREQRFLLLPLLSPARGSVLRHYTVFDSLWRIPMLQFVQRSWSLCVSSRLLISFGLIFQPPPHSSPVHRSTRVRAAQFHNLFGMNSPRTRLLDMRAHCFLTRLQTCMLRTPPASCLFVCPWLGQVPVGRRVVS